MSSEYNYSYRLERERQRELYLARIKANTESFLARFRGKLQDMERKGYSEYIPSEMERLRNDLQSIEDNLMRNNIERAREISVAVGAYINGYRVLVDAVYEKQETERQEKLRQEKAAKETARTELMDEYYRLVSTINDPVIASIVNADMEETREKIANGKLEKSKLVAIFNKVVSEAETKASDWKKATVNKHRATILKAQLSDEIEEAKSKKAENKAQQEEFINQLNNVLQSIDENTEEVEAAQQKMEEITESQTEFYVGEDIRRAAVSAVYKELSKQGFKVDKPKLRDDGFVVVKAKLPAGNRAICCISADGKIQYRFDHYDGMTCLKDIEQFNVDLESIYSIKLSDKRVIWENPDRLYQDAMGETEIKHKEQ